MEPDDSNDPCGAKKVKAMSPGNLPLPSMPGGSWDSSGMVMSPFAPDMNSIASGSYMQGYGGGNPASSSSSNPNLARSSSYDFGGSDLLGGPLSQLADSVNSLDPLSSIEKAINEQVGCGTHMPAPPIRDGSNQHSHNQPHTPQTGPHTPHTPGQQQGPPSVGTHCSSNNSSNTNEGHCSSAIPDTTTSDSGLPSDLNFDPEAVINGEGSGNESLNVSDKNPTYLSSKKFQLTNCFISKIYSFCQILG